MRGVAIPLEIMLGGAIVPGLVLGAGIWATPLTHPKMEYQGETGDITGYRVQFSRLGPFVDYYPNPSDGFHILGELAYSAFSITEDKTDVLVANVKGIAVTGGAGYEWWIGAQWSMGIMGKFSYAHLSGDGETHTLIAPVLVGTATYQ